METRVYNVRFRLNLRTLSTRDAYLDAGGNLQFSFFRRARPPCRVTRARSTQFWAVAENESGKKSARNSDGITYV